MAGNVTNSLFNAGKIASGASNATAMLQKGTTAPKATDTKEPLPLTNNAKPEAPDKQEVTTTELEKTAADLFREIDGDKDLHITEQEFTDAAVQEYNNNGKQIPAAFKSIGDFLMNLVEKFRKFAGADGEMNIDEYKAYLDDEKGSINK